MNADDTGAARGLWGPHAVLMVDDEPQACKWFARLYGNEFTVLTAASVDEALVLLSERGHEVAVLLTDYAMPARDGVALNAKVQRARVEDATAPRRFNPLIASGEATLADAILYRIVHQAHRVKLNGKSLRKNTNKND